MVWRFGVVRGGGSGKKFDPLFWGMGVEQVADQTAVEFEEVVVGHGRSGLIKTARKK